MAQAEKKTDTKRHFKITREFDAPRSLVFDYWTKPELMAKWWGPEGFNTTFKKQEFKVGGISHSCMHGPNDLNIWCLGTFKEIKAPEYYLVSDNFSDEEGNIVDPATFGMADYPKDGWMRVTFEEIDSGKRTRVTVEQSLPEELAKQYGAVEGWGSQFVKLDKILAK